MNLSPPRNPSEAWRQATSLEKARKMEGYTLKVTDIDEVTITNASGVEYVIDTLWETCTCPDYKRNKGACKHILFVLLKQAEEESNG